MAANMALTWLWTKRFSPQAAPKVQIVRQETGVDRLPVELILQILSNVPAIDLFAVKLAGSFYITDIVRQHRSSMSFEDYIRGIHVAIRQRWGNDGPHSAIGLAAARGEVGFYKELEEWCRRSQYNIVVYDRSHASVCSIAQQTEAALVDQKVALHWAAEGGHDDIVQLILKVEGTAATIFPLERKTPAGNAIHLAAANGHESTVSLLLDAGASLECGPKDALVWAAQNGHEGVVCLLMAWGVQVTDDALVGAARNGHNRMIHFLIDNWAKPTHQALSKEWPPIDG